MCVGGDNHEYRHHVRRPIAGHEEPDGDRICPASSRIPAWHNVGRGNYCELCKERRCQGNLARVALPLADPDVLVRSSVGCIWLSLYDYHNWLVRWHVHSNGRQHMDHLSRCEGMVAAERRKTDVCKGLARRFGRCGRNRTRATLYYHHFSEPQEASLLSAGGTWNSATVGCTSLSKSM